MQDGAGMQISPKPASRGCGTHQRTTFPIEKNEDGTRRGVIPIGVISKHIDNTYNRQDFYIRIKEGINKPDIPAQAGQKSVAR
jgi:hypothetical protein